MVPNLDNSNPRWIALQIILQVLQRGRSLDDIFNSDWYQRHDIDKRDLAFARELTYGFCRWQTVLTELLSKQMKKPLRNKDQDVEVILLLGLYQLLVLKTESHAAVNETVKLVKYRKKAWARGLVNGTLRQLIRDQIAIEPDGLVHSYPDWILQRIRQDWGPQADEILSAGNQRAPMTLRVNLSKKSVSEYLTELNEAGLDAQQHSLVPTAVELKQACDVELLPGFSRGLVSVQDASAQIAAGLLQLQPGMRVLDACAAPGGKSIHMLENCDRLELDALDVSEERLQRVQQNLDRCGLSARLVAGDAATPGKWHDGKLYQRILADVPCSASGVIRRHPDIKLLRRDSDLKALVKHQQSIVHSLWGLLEPGGLMLFSSCSIFKDENELQIVRFIEANSDCTEIVPADVLWGQRRAAGFQILPGPSNMDGFYYALLQKSI